MFHNSVIFYHLLVSLFRSNRLSKLVPGKYNSLKQMVTAYV